MPAMGTDTMFSFSSLTAAQKQLLHVIVVPKVLERKSQVLIDVSFNLSKTMCRISATSCCRLQSTVALGVDEILHLNAHRKIEGSIGTTDFLS